jgi:hypothetical protein
LCLNAQILQIKKKYKVFFIFSLTNLKLEIMKKFSSDFSTHQEHNGKGASPQYS